MALPSVLLSQSERNTGKALNHLNLDVMVMPIIDQRHALLRLLGPVDDDSFHG